LPFGRSYSCRWTFGLCFLLVKATFNMYGPECVCYNAHGSKSSLWLIRLVRS